VLSSRAVWLTQAIFPYSIHIVMNAQTPEQWQVEIKAAVEWYESQGKCWLMVVAFLSAKATGHFPPPKGWVSYRRKR
jgi:hypothetical protein